MVQDSLISFLENIKQYDKEIVIENPGSLSLNKLPGLFSECFIFNRGCNIEDMASEDDEQYVFSTPDYRITKKFNRFQTKILLKQFSPSFTEERIDLIIRFAWNYPKIAVNKITADYTPYSDSMGTFPPMANSYGPPIRRIPIEQ